MNEGKISDIFQPMDYKLLNIKQLTTNLCVFSCVVWFCVIAAVSWLCYCLSQPFTSQQLKSIDLLTHFYNAILNSASMQPERERTKTNENVFFFTFNTALCRFSQPEHHRIDFNSSTVQTYKYTNSSNLKTLYTAQLVHITYFCCCFFFGVYEMKYAYEAHLFRARRFRFFLFLFFLLVSSSCRVLLFELLVGNLFFGDRPDRTMVVETL